MCCEWPRPTDVLTLHWSVRRSCSARCLEMAKKEEALEASHTKPRNIIKSPAGYLVPLSSPQE